MTTTKRTGILSIKNVSSVVVCRAGGSRPVTGGGGGRGIRGRSDFSVTNAAAVPSPQGGAKRATTGSERGGRREIWIRGRGETRYKCILLRMNSLPLGVCLCLTLNEGDERDDQRRGDRFDPAPHFAGGEASDQNRGYVHSRLITLSHRPIPFLVTSHVSLKRSTSVQLLRNGSGISQNLGFVVASIQFP